MDNPKMWVVPTNPLEAALLRAMPRLRRTCRHLAPSPAAADDLLQETLIRALSRPPTDLDRDIGPWLDRVARNLAIDSRRADREAPAAEPEPADHSEQPDLGLLEQAQQAWLGALARLNPLQRSVFLLRELADCSGAEVARLLHISEASVRVHLHRGRQRLANRNGGEARLEPALVEQLAKARVSSFGDFIRLGRRFDGLSPLWVGPQDPQVWSALLELMVAASPQNRETTAYLHYLKGAAANRRMQSIAALEHLAAALEAAGSDSQLRCLVLHEQAIVATRAYDQGLGADALAALQDQPGLSRVLHCSSNANLAWRRGDARRAEQEARAALAQTDDAWQRSRLVVNLAMYENQQGDYAKALARLDVALAELESANDQEALSRLWNTRGMALQNMGDLDEAETCFEFAVQHDVAFQGASGGYTPLGNLALLRAEQGHFDDALSVLQQARRRNQQGNKDARSMAISSANLGMVHHFRDDLPAALADLDRAAIEATAIGDERLLAHVLAHRGAVHGRLGQPDASSSDLARARELAQPEQTPILDALAAAATADVDREGAALTLSRLTQQAPRRCTTRLAVGLLAAALG